jgi:Mg-chelatase subunit ChlD
MTAIMNLQGESMKVGLCFSVLCFLVGSVSWAGGAAQAEETTARGKYVAEQGMIIPAHEVNIGSYISSIDYGYADPQGELGVNLYTGHRQVSVKGQEEIIQIGIQGMRRAFEDLPVLNLAFVFDKSGSMSEPDKIQMAKEAFGVFIRRMRWDDIVSVVTFDEDAELLLVPALVGAIDSISRLTEDVFSVMAEGASNLAVGLLAGLEQVQVNFRPDYVNRVIFISDGLGKAERAFEIAGDFKKRGITLSTISVGMKCDLKTMGDLAKEGAGSSRFLSDSEKIEEVFNAELDRMVVPIAYNLSMELELLEDTELVETWGYDHSTSGSKTSYFLPALHHRDYETILAHVRLPPEPKPGSRRVARFSLEYEDRKGAVHSSGPYFILVEYADSVIASGGISHPIVLRAGTMLHTAQALEEIGFLYYAGQEESGRQSFYSNLSWQSRDVSQSTHLDRVVSSERAEMAASIRAKKQRCLDLSVALKKEIQNTRLRLDEEYFEDELGILEKYIEILGGELGLGQIVISRLLQDLEIHPAEETATRYSQLEDLVSELTLALEGREEGSIAFFGFAERGEGASSVRAAADSLALSSLRGLRGFELIREGAIDEALSSFEVSLPDLMDNDVAFEIGSSLRADYLVTGSVMALPSTVVVFGKILNTGTGAVESVAQVILPREDSGKTAD